MLNNAQIYSSLPAQDVERAKNFYKEKLNIIPKEERNGNAIYEIGGSKFFLYFSPSAGTNQATAACISVDNIESTVKELEQNGVSFEEYDNIPGISRSGAIHSNDEGMKCAWFKDSEGNILSVSEF